MNNFSYVLSDINSLNSFLKSPEITVGAEDSTAVLIQVFSSQKDITLFASITGAILSVFPSAVIVGSTTSGEIVEGLLNTGTVVLSISFFESTIIKPIEVSCIPGSEFETGKEMICSIKALGTDIAGVLLYAAPLGINLAEIFKGMAVRDFSFPVFGGGAGVYNSEDEPLIFCSDNIVSQGLIAVVFIGEETQIYTKTFLGWRPFSKEMTITDIDGMLVKKVDDECAFDIYSRYLNIKNDNNFFENVLEFPLLLERDGGTVARVPFYLDKNGYIGFKADLKAGEKFRIGYGDPETIVEKSKTIQREIRNFEPDAIFLYACVCRRFLMQNDVNLETLPFNSIAPTVGFYTGSEFYSHENKVQLQNSTIVVVGIREGNKGRKPRRTEETESDADIGANEKDPYSNKHNLIVSRLLYFISAITTDLEDANRELTRISGIDKLTHIYNRFKLDEILQTEISMSRRYNTVFSIILMDIDFFKEINDTFGHLTGDDVLSHLAGVLKASVREIDSVGRWGGDEFLIILPQTSLIQAAAAAEKICNAVTADQPQVTCSFGVTTYCENDSQDKILMRADKALYRAKSGGRNRVSSMVPDES